MNHEKKEEKIKITDRRRFSGEGEPLRGEETTSEKSVNQSKNNEKDEWSHHPINFLTFILSLATSAQVHLGAIPNPTTGKQEKNLGLAQQTIDILGILQEKTAGNLEEEEEKLLTSLLYDLRVMFVDAQKEGRS